MNKKKLGKVTGVATASFLIAGTTAFTAFAAMPSGTAVIGNKSYDLNYVNNPANQEEITAAMVAADFKVYVKDFAGNWIVNETEAALNDLSVIPAVAYKAADGTVTNYEAKDGNVVSDVLKVEGVTAINANTLTVTGTGLSKLQTTDVTLSGYTVSSISPSADGKTAAITLGDKLAPNTEVTVKVLDTEYKVTYKFDVTKLVVDETTFDDERSNQKVTFKIDGATADVDYLALAGYTVNFVATDKDGNAFDIFDSTNAGNVPADSNVSSTGILGTGIAIGDYKVEVQLLKSGSALISDVGTIKVANIDADVTTINSVYFANNGADLLDDSAYNTAYTNDDFTMNSTTLVAGEKANVNKITATVSGVTSVVASTDFTVESSNPAVISINPTTYELTANAKGTAVITVKVGTQAKTFNFTVSNDVRKLKTVKPSIATAKGVIGADDISVKFTSLDQYGDPFAIATGDPAAAVNIDQAVETLPTASGNSLVTDFELVTDTANSVGVSTIALTPAQVGTGTVYFKNSDGVVVGSLSLNITDNGAIASNKLELVSVIGQSTDNSLEVTNALDKKVTYKLSQYNASGILLGAAVFVNPTPAAGEYSVTAVDPTVASVAIDVSTKSFTVTALKKGSTDIVIKDSEGKFVAKTTVAVTNTPYEISSVAFKSVGTIDYTGKNIYAKDIFNTTASEADDIVNGVTLTKASSSKVRIAETLPVAYTDAVIAVNDLYLDLDNNGVVSNGDLKLATVSAVAASDVNGTFTVTAYGAGDYVANSIITGGTASGDKGTVIIKIMEDAADDTTAITSTSFYVNVK